MGKNEYWLMLGTLIVLTCLDTVLVAVLFYYYTDTYATYLNQATGTVYSLVSTLHILALRHCGGDHRHGARAAASLNDDGDNAEAVAADAPTANDAAQRRPNVPWTVLVAIGVLNGTGNFLAAIGEPHTRAETQCLLSLTGIPLVLLLSWAALGVRPNAPACAAAALIIGASAVSVLPTVLGNATDDDGAPRRARHARRDEGARETPTPPFPTVHARAWPLPSLRTSHLACRACPRPIRPPPLLSRA